MSIDYSLFLFSRLREETLLLNRTLYEALDITLATAGRIVIISGAILAVCFLGLSVIPFVAIQTIGVGASFSIFFAVIVNLTLGPSLLLVCPGLATFYKSWFNKKQSNNGNVNSTSESDDVVILKRTYVEESGLLNHHTEMAPIDKNASFYRLGVWVTAHPWFVIISVMVVLLPFIWPAAIMKTTLDFTQMLPSDSSSVDGWKLLQHEFGVGVVSPFYIIVQSSCTDGGTYGCLMSQNGFDIMQSIVQHLITTVPGLLSSTYITLEYPLI